MHSAAMQKVDNTHICYNNIYNNMYLGIVDNSS